MGIIDEDDLTHLFYQNTVQIPHGFLFAVLNLLSSKAQEF